MFLQLLEPVLLLGKERFAGVDIRVRVKGGGHVAQIYGESPERGIRWEVALRAKPYSRGFPKLIRPFVCLVHSNSPVHLQSPGGLLPEM